MIKTKSHLFNVGTIETNKSYFQLNGIITAYYYKDKTVKTLEEEAEAYEEHKKRSKEVKQEAEIIIENLPNIGLENQLCGYFYTPLPMHPDKNPFSYLFYNYGIAQSYSTIHTDEFGNALKVPVLDINPDRKINIIKWESRIIQPRSRREEAEVYQVFIVMPI